MLPASNTTQNAYIESFSGEFRDACVNER
ncbi:hypothetical protein C266_19066 [Pandoraea sp. SD6-2]|nr:hypothetical protein C266_19066 [Pandoraea sp. SD6-2]